MPRRRNSWATASPGPASPPGLSRITNLMLSGMVLTRVTRSRTTIPLMTSHVSVRVTWGGGRSLGMNKAEWSRSHPERDTTRVAAIPRRHRDGGDMIGPYGTHRPDPKGTGDNIASNTLTCFSAPQIVVCQGMRSLLMGHL